MARSTKTPTDKAAPKSRSRKGFSVGGVALTPLRLITVLLVALSIVFIAENTAQTEIRLLVPVITMPLWVALLGTLLIGGLIGVLVAGGKRGTARDKVGKV